MKSLLKNIETNTYNMTFSFSKEEFLKPRSRDIKPILKPIKNRFKTKKFEEPKERFFEWYSEESKSSIMNEELKFTNYLPDTSLNGEEELRLDELKNDLHCLRMKPYNHVTNVKNNERLRTLISSYVESGIDQNYLDFIYKINFTDLLGRTTAFRVFYLYEVDGLENKYKHSILFIDPYHLVISSSHKGKDKLTQLNENFEKNKHNKKDIKIYLENNRMFD
ncbi:hypothetical protein LZ578_08265 [Jeotgalibaca sp. MA1X17-3]|uniref:hypothetical protein n=1 Tax=Jeotgalibaca sp. MA1X17-3 TaxID=2908211 RepID=UPI001F3D5E70|nr:hypothetical protein [Jeotgalibaca sp. MA1X17-3]UJF15000.1 hypothetical protein LZ578_08265 [Jeotgalibaca sp. MA1X17-3]